MWFVVLLGVIGAGIAAIVLTLRRKPTEPDIPPTPLTLPHPEEPANYSQTMGNTDLDAVIRLWKYHYKVTDPFWDRVKVYLSEAESYAAWTISQTAEIWVRPEWCNPGVIAHEMCHISYWQLSQAQKDNFAFILSANLNHPSLELIRAVNGHLHSDPIEAHADIYRYLGDGMPEVFTEFYPYLMEAV